jgi:hypothetical protein
MNINKSYFELRMHVDIHFFIPKALPLGYDILPLRGANKTILKLS